MNEGYSDISAFDNLATKYVKVGNFSIYLELSLLLDCHMSNLKLVLMNIYDIFVVLLFNNPAIALVIMSILRHFIPQKRIL